MIKLIHRIKDWIVGRISGHQCAAVHRKQHDVGFYCQKRMGHLGKHIDICKDKWSSK